MTGKHKVLPLAVDTIERAPQFYQARVCGSAEILQNASTDMSMYSSR
jgi:hypothetical protein